jgi:hypothetical protein
MWVDGRPVNAYRGNGAHATAIAAEREPELAARREELRACREADLAMRRSRRLVESLDELLLAGGYIRCRGEIRPKGRITMRGMAGRSGSLDEAMERERARRRFAQAPDVDRLIERYRVDIAHVHLRELVDRVVHDPDQREATRLHILREADTLAGSDATELITQVALAVVMLDCEYHFASIAHLKALEVPRLADHYLKWRETIDKRLNQKLKTLGIVRHLDATELRSRLSTLRLVS